MISASVFVITIAMLMSGNNHREQKSRIRDKVHVCMRREVQHHVKRESVCGENVPKAWAAAYTWLQFHRENERENSSSALFCCSPSWKDPFGWSGWSIMPPTVMNTRKGDAGGKQWSIACQLWGTRCRQRFGFGARRVRVHERRRHELGQLLFWLHVARVTVAACDSQGMMKDKLWENSSTDLRICGGGGVRCPGQINGQANTCPAHTNPGGEKRNLPQSKTLWVPVFSDANLGVIFFMHERRQISVLIRCKGGCWSPAVCVLFSPHCTAFVFTRWERAQMCVVVQMLSINRENMLGVWSVIADFG
jgi:hypothetical protein